MNWNETGKIIRKAGEGISEKIFGAIQPFRLLDFKTPRKARSFETCSSGKSVQKILWEIKLKKSRAIEFNRRFQNR